MKRSAMPPRSTRLVSRVPIARMSRKRRRALAERARVRAHVLERDGYRCQAATVLPDIACWHPAGAPLDVHELVRRSQWSAGWLHPSNCLTLCRAHHRLISENPDLGHAVGLVRWSWEARK